MDSSKAVNLECLEWITNLLFQLKGSQIEKKQFRMTWKNELQQPIFFKAFYVDFVSIEQEKYIICMFLGYYDYLLFHRQISSGYI